MLTIIFLALSLIHFYWAFRSEWAFDRVLPTNEDGVRAFTPKKVVSAAVGFVLVFFAIFYFNRDNLTFIGLPSFILYYIGWIIPSLFALRIIGDFKYCGLFKKIKGTTFSKMDTKYFIPICAIISVLGFIVQFKI